MALAARSEEGISAFIVEKNPGPRFEGISVSKNVSKLGYRGVETVEMAYADHRIPAANLVGEPGRGLPQILSVLEIGRINIAARAVGVARAAFDAALLYAQQRETFGKVIGEHQAIQLKLADMATRLEAARLLTKNAAERKAAGLRCDVEAGMAKLFASETALELSIESMRIHGGVGYTTELPVERLYRDAPLMVIGEGTNEIQRLVIARGLLAPRPRSVLRSNLGQHLRGVGAELRRRRGGTDWNIRKADWAVDGPPWCPVGVVAEFEEPVIRRQLRVDQNVGRALCRRPPDALGVKTLRPLGQTCARRRSRRARRSPRRGAGATTRASAKRGSP